MVAIASFLQTTNVPDDAFENYLEIHTATGAVIAVCKSVKCALDCQPYVLF